jgi:hypothetical protein
MMKTVTHTAYIFDDGMGTPLEVRVWTIVGDSQWEQCQILFVPQTPDERFYSLISLSLLFLDRPFAYVFLMGHIAHFRGMKVVDARWIHEVVHPHEVFHHMLDIYTQHVFLTKQLEVARGGEA